MSDPHIWDMEDGYAQAPVVEDLPEFDDFQTFLSACEFAAVSARYASRYTRNQPVTIEVPLVVEMKDMFISAEVHLKAWGIRLDWTRWNNHHAIAQLLVDLTAGHLWPLLESQGHPRPRRYVLTLDEQWGQV